MIIFLFGLVLCECVEIFISGYNHTDEAKAKISEAMKNPSEETRLKMSKASKIRS